MCFQLSMILNETVYYIEPYPKSKALDFYKKEITENELDTTKVQFLPFVGVGPRKFVDLFTTNSIRSYARIRKDESGKVIKWEEKNASLRNPLRAISYIEFESVTSEELIIPF